MQMLNVISFYLYIFYFEIAGKGDLVGCDISLNMMHGVNGQAGAGGTGAQDFILKSSSDVKVGRYLSYVNV